MAQLMMKSDILATPLLREHIASNVEEIETILPKGSPLIVQIQRISKNLFGAHFRVRLFGRQIVFRVQDTNIFSAVVRARRGLLRQVDDVKSLSRELTRHRLR